MNNSMYSSNKSMFNDENYTWDDYQNYTSLVATRKKLIAKKLSWEKYIKNLENLKNLYVEISDDLSNSSNAFTSGGYIDDTPIDNGELSTLATYFSTSSESLATIISNSNIRISEFETSIINMKSQVINARPPANSIYSTINEDSVFESPLSHQSFDKSGDSYSNYIM